MLFDFEESTLMRTCLEDAYDAVTELDLWDYLRDNTFESFTYYKGPDEALHAKLLALVDKRNLHSGASYGITMRNMESIAKEGYETWKLNYLNANE
jgi:hypothetical protein